MRTLCESEIVAPGSTDWQRSMLVSLRYGPVVQKAVLSCEFDDLCDGPGVNRCMRLHGAGEERRVVWSIRESAPSIGPVVVGSRVEQTRVARYPRLLK